MKNYSILLLFLLVSFSSKAQNWYAVAIADSGILTVKYKFTIDTGNSLIDTISLDQARSIRAINALSIVKDVNNPRRQVIERVKVSKFEITISDKEELNKSYFLGTSEILTNEMQEDLRKMSPGAMLVFEGIVVVSSNGLSSSAMPLMFHVK